ncbi:bifunctional hydroxymethylpyrimidine kinase/phosphomethylpyrimidine kinase [Candidatus Epulonipiscium viviparus]|uniref:bifunctional hydroxymethylpyrimidine kinase/phosphomethylpyrimidine kinase n=1 Tax=Candidatus Epulonipiscium viviparus TaxID=420336 RepID=UPI00016C008E|nr:bifunctional hydroxymethylpyrimidine kinase/phosphomethylpyrimidine kinase [Candidatus Epulopiscium viviparus]
MKCSNRVMRLYAVTDRAWTDKATLPIQVKQALEGGITCLQLRDKNHINKEETLEIKNLCAKYGVPFIINDDIAAAMKYDADGIHVGQDDMAAADVRKRIGEEKILGVTVHNVTQAIKAEKDGADYLGVGAVFKTDTKTDAVTIGIAEVAAIVSAVNIPVVAIGGINLENIKQLKRANVDGVAVVSAIFGSDDISATCAKLLAESEKIARMATALTIAGSDCSGGAGIQADLKTFVANKVYGMSVITALTAQNTMGVSGIFDVSAEFVASQIDSVFVDIYPNAIKIGMVSNIQIVDAIVAKIKQYKPKNIVIDPVMVSTSGHKLLSDGAEVVVIEKLLPCATVITPNIPEAEILWNNKSINTEEDMMEAAEYIAEKVGVAVLVKGGHLVNEVMDFLFADGVGTWYTADRVETANTHGTGCTLSSAIAANLAKGYSLEASITNAKKYLTGALKANLDLGHGSGPLDHAYMIGEHCEINR